MEIFEYKTIAIHKYEILDDDRANKLGELGWELVTIYEYRDGFIAATFKRKKIKIK